MFNIFKKKKEYGLGMGAVPDPIDARDYKYSEVAGAATLSDDEWKKGYDVEKELGFTIPFKNQGGTLSCTGQSGTVFVSCRASRYFR